jgi:hypothetical protein
MPRQSQVRARSQKHYGVKFVREKKSIQGRANSSRRNMKNEAMDEISGLKNCNIIRGSTHSRLGLGRGF